MSTITKVLLGGMLITQLDFIGWGLGFIPTRIHDKISKSISAMRSSLITLDKMVKVKNWEGARAIVSEIKLQMLDNLSVRMPVSALEINIEELLS